MGNRAVITTRKDLKDIGVYLHWNGGRDSVEGFLAAFEQKSLVAQTKLIFNWHNGTYYADDIYGKIDTEVKNNG